MKNIVCALAGAAVGFAAAIFALNGRYEKRVREEVDSVKEELRKERPIKRRSARQATPKSRETAPTVQEPTAARPKPRVISPEEFAQGENSEVAYEVSSITLYSDGTVADEADHVMSEEDIVRMIGADSLQRFGEYEDDAVYVRNDALRTDFEILVSDRRYGEILREKPYLKKRIGDDINKRE